MILDVTPSILGPKIMPFIHRCILSVTTRILPSPSLPLAVDFVVFLGPKPLLAFRCTTHRCDSITTARFGSGMIRTRHNNWTIVEVALVQQLLQMGQNHLHLHHHIHLVGHNQQKTCLPRFLIFSLFSFRCASAASIHSHHTTATPHNNRYLTLHPFRYRPLSRTNNKLYLYSLEYHQRDIFSLYHADNLSRRLSNVENAESAVWIVTCWLWQVHRRMISYSVLVQHDNVLSFLSLIPTVGNT